MGPIVRGLLAVVAAVATFYFVGWFGAALLSAVLPPAVAFSAAFLASMLLAALVARHVWTWSGGASTGLGRSLVGSAVAGAAIVGGLGFVAGFFGPLIFAPEANQGPLLGLFFTGPLGVVVGAVGGCIVALCRRRAG